MKAERNPSRYKEFQIIFILYPVWLLKVCDLNNFNISSLLRNPKLSNK